MSCMLASLGTPSPGAFRVNGECPWGLENVPVAHVLPPRGMIAVDLGVWDLSLGSHREAEGRGQGSLSLSIRLRTFILRISSPDPGARPPSEFILSAQEVSSLHACSSPKLRSSRAGLSGTRDRFHVLCWCPKCP